MSHPSYLELDRHALGAGAPETAAHVGGCPQCRDYVTRARPAEVVPAWVGELAAPRRAKPWWLSGGLVAVAALVLMWLRPSDPYVGIKGMPSALVYVHRDHTTSLWDQAPLRAGDRIRLEVVPEHFEHVSVFSTGARNSEPMQLYAGHIKPFARALLPKTWQVDAVGDAEHLAIVFSHAPLSKDAASTLFRAHDPAAVHIVRLTLPKK